MVTRKKTAPAKPAAVPPADEPTPALEDILVALQKSFSRLSYRTAQAPEDAARALIVGKVDFEIVLNAEPRGDQLRYEKTGSMNLRLKGQISTDIRVVDGERDA